MLIQMYEYLCNLTVPMASLVPMCPASFHCSTDEMWRARAEWTKRGATNFDLTTLWLFAASNFNGSTFSVHTLIPGIEPSVSPCSPLGRLLAHVVLGREVAVWTLLLE